MAKELIIYSSLNRYSAESAVNQLNSIDDNEELTVRMNTPGGGVIDGWSIISRLSERTAKTNGIIDGQAASMGAVMLLFFDNVVANDTSLIMFHKAAYSSWYEPNEAEKDLLNKINKQFEAKIKKKVEGKEGSEEFLAKLFEKNVRNDVELTMKEAKKLGIISKIRTLEPKSYHGTQMVAMFEDDKLYVKANNTPKSGDNHKLKSNYMNLEQLKADHPALYAQLFALGEASGETKGVLAENQRVKSWMVFQAIAPDKVKAGIESGKGIDPVANAEFNLLFMQSGKLKAMESESPEDVKTEKEVLTAEQIKTKAEQAADDKVIAEFYGEETSKTE